MSGSILFVTGDRPDRFKKAFNSPAGTVCIDLEDGVAPEKKAYARQHCLEALRHDVSSKRTSFRLNHPTSEEGQLDLMLFRMVEATSLLIPKVENVSDITKVQDNVSHDTSLMAIIESTIGMSNVFEIAKMPSVKALIFGSGDWSTETGSDMGWDALLYARSKIIHAATEARITAVDGAWLNIRDLEGLALETQRVRTLGFRNKIALHPAQVPVINKALALSNNEKALAMKIVKAFEAANGDTILVEGRMVDKPIYDAAKKSLRPL